MNSIIHDYIIIEIFHFLEQKNILKQILNEWFDLSWSEKIENIKFMFIFLEFKNIVYRSSEKYFFTEEFREKFSSSGYAEFLIFSWYKNHFNFLSSPEVKIKDNERVAEWSYMIARKEYELFFQNYLWQNSVTSFLDLGCWNADFLIFLAKKFKNIQFYWIEIDVSSFNISLQKIKTLGLPNITIFNNDIKDIKKLDLPHMDLISWFFIFHELITSDKDFLKLLKDIIWKLNPKIFILKELNLPSNLLDENLRDMDNFFMIHYAIHSLSNQTTYNIHKWKYIFSYFWFNMVNIQHSQKYDEKNSFYPLMEFIKT